MKVKHKKDTQTEVEGPDESAVNEPTGKRPKKSQHDEGDGVVDEEKKNKRRNHSGGELEGPDESAANEPTGKRLKKRQHDDGVDVGGEKKQRRKQKDVDVEEPDEAATEEPTVKRPKKRRHDKGEDASAEAEKEDKPEEKTSAGKKNRTGEADELEPTTVFVGGFPFSVDEETLRSDFEVCGEVVDLKYVTDKATGKPRGIAFVTFKDQAGVAKALEYDKTDYGGRILEVYQAEARGRAFGPRPERTPAISREFEAFIKGIPAGTKEEALRSMFEDCGSIERLNMPTRGGGRCKGFAWITFSNKKGLDKALKLNGEELNDAKLMVEASSDYKTSGSGDSGGNPKGKGKGKGKSKGKGKGVGNTEREIFLSNLPYEAEEEQVKNDFLECGQIERMHMPLRSDGKCMGFAWISFATMDGLNKALEYDGDDYGGRRLKVEKSGQHKSASGKTS